MLIKNLKNKTKTLLAVSTLALCISCQSGTTGNSTSSTSSGSTEFPLALAIASPLSTETTSSASINSNLVKLSTTSSYTHSYTNAMNQIELLINGTTPSLCTFDPSDFLQQSQDAECFGPQVAYQNHPDASGSEPTDGTLPTGDLGLWSETDDNTGHACSAAQLNSKMESVQSKSNASLMGLATMVCTINSNGLSMPDSSTPSVDITTEMNTLGISDTTFTNASITFDASTGTYAYNLDLTYAPGSDSYEIVVDMEHTPTAVATVYEGKMSYLVNDSYTGGNCPSSDVTFNGSLEYVSNSTTDMEVEVRAGTFCEHDSDGRDSNNLIDPSDKYDATTNTDGWGNNFSIFTANFDPQTMDGDYAYTWQAGPQDSHSRAFNVNISNSGVDGLAFYGYGDEIATTDGSIAGFICNWAGPSADHTLVEYAQHQVVEFDSSTGLINATSSNIEYAPTTSCEYDGTGSFVFDTNLDGSVADEDASIATTNDMYEADDIDGDSTATIEETIDDLGFTLPVIS